MSELEHQLSKKIVDFALGLKYEDIPEDESRMRSF